MKGNEFMPEELKEYFWDTEFEKLDKIKANISKLDMAKLQKIMAFPAGMPDRQNLYRRPPSGGLRYV